MDKDLIPSASPPGWELGKYTPGLPAEKRLSEVEGSSGESSPIGEADNLLDIESAHSRVPDEIRPCHGTFDRDDSGRDLAAGDGLGHDGGVPSRALLHGGETRFGIGVMNQVDLGLRQTPVHSPAGQHPDQDEIERCFVGPDLRVPERV